VRGNEALVAGRGWPGESCREAPRRPLLRYLSLAAAMAAAPLAMLASAALGSM
jgi:hypothetical protein